MDISAIRARSTFEGSCAMPSCQGGIVSYDMFSHNCKCNERTHPVLFVRVTRFREERSSLPYLSARDVFYFSSFFTTSGFSLCD